MAALGSQSIASSYEQLLHVDADGGGNGTTHVSIKDGDNGTTFGFTIATDSLMMTGTNRLEFGDNASYIHQSADGVLDLVSDTEIEINATTIDMNGAVDMSSTLALAGDLNVDTDTLFVDVSADKVGINDASPAAALTIKGATAGTANSYFLIENAGDTNSSVRIFEDNTSPTSGKIWIYSDNSEKIQLWGNGSSYFNGGNVGIGDTNPNEAKLSIDNVQSGDVGINLKNTQATTALKIDQDGNGSSINIDSESTDQDVIFIDTASTSGKALHIDANFLTNGMIVDINSNSSDNTARTLVSIINDHTSAANTTAMKITQDADTTGVLVDTTHSSFAGNGTILQATGRSKNSGFNFLTTKTGGDTEDVHHLVGDGTVVADGAYSSGGADYAEYFESKDGKAIAVGTTIKLDGDKIVACEDGDTPIGVVRTYGNSVVIGNSAPLKWDNKYQKDDYGADIMEEYSVTEWIEETDEINTEAVEKVLYVEGDNIPEGKEIGDVKIEAKAATYKTKDVQYQTDKIPSDVKVPSDATIASTEKDGTKLMRRKLNSDYDENKTYIPRKKRDEWCLVGLIGQIPITKGQPMASNWIKMKDISNSVEMYLVK